jgi:tRNA dimethylallyltransferase
MSTRYLIVLTGPTAVGKTDMAIILAEHFNTEIINADSRQVYREMRIGTAVPDPGQLAAVKHHFIGHKSVEEHYNASIFEIEAIALMDHLFDRFGVAILTGGSGLYIDAVCKGIDDIPSVDPQIRVQLHREYLRIGLPGIQARLKDIDPVYYAKVDQNNPKRILKALEITEMSGRPYSSFLTGRSKSRDFIVWKIGLDMPRRELYARINTRVDKMMADGLLEEARDLIEFRNLNALNTVGYKELFAYLDGLHSLDEAVTLIKGHTRQYARRQLTWLRKDKEIKWYHPDQKELIIGYLHEKMKSE